MGLKLTLLGLFLIVQTVFHIPAAEVVGSVIMLIGVVLLFLDK